MIREEIKEEEQKLLQDIVNQNQVVEEEEKL